ncbi:MULTISPECIES: shikimate dehydrogenase [unclassified Phycicoccus]|uniref:shikimate dehydrogenase n=1 Tax=unclassified Phycicoccus TaxID=2637926 RepID=UPI000702DF4F|nr:MULTISPECIES: shikimate dehydrogenase [unclassified Phycicoccus]KRF22614.1 shikimate dehydrogenase [Phycicoccus sp. Soil802]KRF24701.1 shikimate dehydrogenase [Phycicoccus sp. Soil803]
MAEPRRAAVLGSPVAHSLSPVLHRAGYRTLGLTGWSYVAQELTEAELPGWVAGLDATWRGLSLTMPLKEAAFSVATTVTETARVTGSVNTLVRRRDGGWDAHNTDVRGLEAALAEAEHDGTATLLGGGATARSAVLALGSLGVQRIRLVVRGDARPETLRLAVHAGIAVDLVPLASWGSAHPGGLVVSTLPPAAGELAARALGTRKRRGTLMDVVYADWPTPLATAAAATGMHVVSGLDMLVYQAAEQFRLFTGQQPPVQAMYAAGRQALGR